MPNFKPSSCSINALHLTMKISSSVHYPLTAFFLHIRNTLQVFPCTPAGVPYLMILLVPLWTVSYIFLEESCPLKGLSWITVRFQRDWRLLLIFTHMLLNAFENLSAVADRIQNSSFTMLPSMGIFMGVMWIRVKRNYQLWFINKIFLI